MPERVVDVLEAIEVEDRDRDPQLGAPRERQRVGEPLAEQPAVGQPGDGVVVGLVTQLLLDAIALEHLREHLADARGEREHLRREVERLVRDALDHREHRPLDDDRERDRPLEAEAARQRVSGELDVVGDVDQAQRATLAQHATRQPLPLGEPAAADLVDEHPVGVLRTGVVRRGAAQVVRRGVVQPGDRDRAAEVAAERREQMLERLLGRAGPVGGGGDRREQRELLLAIVELVGGALGELLGLDARRPLDGEQLLEPGVPVLGHRAHRPPAARGVRASVLTREPSAIGVDRLR